MMLIIYYIMMILLMMLIAMILMNGTTYIINMNILNTTWNLSLSFNNIYMILFSTTVITLSIFIVFYCLQYMNSDISIIRFSWIMIYFIISMLMLNLSNSIWTLWLGWEFLGVTSFLLIIYYSNWKSSNSSMTTLMMNRIGDFSLLVTMIPFCYYMLWDVNNFKFPSWFCIIMLMAIFAKSAQIPFQSWLPIAMAAPTPVSSLVHSSTLVVAGVIICMKMNNYFFNNSMFLLTMMGFITSFYASMMAIFEKDFKKIMAYSTMSQIALVMFMVSSNLTKLMMFHIINHAFTKALLFMMTGLYILHTFGNQESRSMEMKLLNNHIISFMLIMSILIMCGSFFTSCYYSKEYQLIFTQNQESLSYLTNMMIFMSFAYSIRMIIYILMNMNQKIMQNYMTNSNILYIILMLISLFSGWLLSYNFSIPFNMDWSTKKMWMMFLPLLIIIMTTHTFKSTTNLDIQYNLPIKNMMNISFFTHKKNKIMSLSYNLILKQYSFMSNFKFILIPIISLMLISIS